MQRHSAVYFQHAPIKLGPLINEHLFSLGHNKITQSSFNSLFTWEENGNDGIDPKLRLPKSRGQELSDEVITCPN